MNASGATLRSTTAALTLTRAELYARVWATPMQRLSAEFGVSDVAIAKLCHRRNVPRPPPGYWAKRAAGHAIEPPPLPPAQPGQDRVVVFRRASISPVSHDTTARPAMLHPIAERVNRCLSRYKARAYGLVLVSEPDLPRVLASPAQAGRIAALLHELLEAAAARDICFRAGESSVATFQRADRSASLRIEETLRCDTSAARTLRLPSGRLVVTVRGPGGARRDVTRWEESDSLTLSRIGELVLELLNAKLAPARVAPAPVAPAAIFPRRAVFNHLAPTRLLREARHWENFALLERYVAACENRWANDASGLTPARDAWLAWAKGTVQALSPFTSHPADEDLRHDALPASSALFVTAATALRRHSC